MGQFNIDKMITDKVIDALENGTCPWHKSWSVQSGVPRNGITNKPYRGINIVLCAINNYTNPYYFTIKQIKDKKMRVRYAEMCKPTILVYWNFDWKAKNEDEEEEENTKSYKKGFMRYYKVWNAEQLEEIPEKYQVKADATYNNNPIEEAEKIVEGFKDKPTVIEKPTESVFYRQADDSVTINPINLFESSEEYYSTLFHEFGHSTLHPKRLKRKNPSYAFEELVAEMTAIMLSDKCGIVPKIIDNSVAYLAGWAKKLKEDPKLIRQASQFAANACDYIMGVKYEGTD